MTFYNMTINIFIYKAAYLGQLKLNQHQNQFHLI